MKSMTGYGRATVGLGSDTITIQVSSVNRKTLDLTVKLPEEWAALEPVITEKGRRHAARGKVHVQIELTGAAGSRQEVWDETAAVETLNRLAAFASRQGIGFTPTP